MFGKIRFASETSIGCAQYFMQQINSIRYFISRQRLTENCISDFMLETSKRSLGMRNFGNFAIDNCGAAFRNTMDGHDYSNIGIKWVGRLDRVFVEWMGYSFSCSYGRNVISVETIGL